MYIYYPKRIIMYIWPSHLLHTYHQSKNRLWSGYDQVIKTILFTDGYAQRHMDLKMIACPNCHGVIEYDASNKTGFCGYCHTKFLVDSSSQFGTSFDLSDYTPFKLSSSMSDNNGAERLSMIADSIITEDEDKRYLGWYYKGLFHISTFDLSNAINCWIKTVDTCNDRDELARLYHNMISALIRIKIDWDRVNLSINEHLDYPSLKLLDRALERSRYIDYKLYDIYFDMILNVRELCINSLSFEEFQSVNDTLGSIVRNALFTYADISLLYDILKKAVEIENIGTLVFIRHAENEPLDSLNDEMREMINPPLDRILTMVKTFSMSDDSFQYGWSITLTTIMFHHYLLERMEYYSKIMTPDVVMVITDHIISEYDYKAMFEFTKATEIDNDFEDCNPFNNERKRKELKESAELTIDYLFEPILKYTKNPKIEEETPVSVDVQTNEPESEKKKGFFSILKKRKR